MEKRKNDRALTQFRQRWRQNYGFRTVISAGLSLCSTMIFALYHGFLGAWLSSLWHGSICVFYLLLVFIRGMVLLTEYLTQTMQDGERARWRQRIFFLSSAMLFLLNIALILPISLMVLLRKPVNIGLIPAIAMAAYTTYKMTMAIIHMRRSSPHPLLVRELRTINLIDALVSILTLQNTLIMVKRSAGQENAMLPLSAISSAIIYLGIVLLTVRLFLKNKPGRSG